ncbi:MAG TPA: STAS domain-containing protein, partial [Verrucomicrobiae bacterium]|nr:STAS domain-containing protein [Verrucomicrobiae bacterium]
IKISGRANFSSSVDFKTVVQELCQRGCAYFVLDLSECTLMDSTFLGVLAGFGLQGKSGKCGQTSVVLELLNPNERVTELLESLGVLQLFKLTHGPLQLPQTAAAQAVAGACPTKEDVRRACLEAHETLMQINPANASKFKEVAAFLSEDLKKARPGL